MRKKVETLSVLSVSFLVCIRVLPEPPLEHEVSRIFYVCDGKRDRFASDYIIDDYKYKKKDYEKNIFIVSPCCCKHISARAGHSTFAGTNPVPFVINY